MKRIKYVEAKDVRLLIEDIIDKLRDYFSHIDLSRIIVLRSFNARTTALARIHALPRIWRETLGLEPIYIIEVVSENFDRLDYDTKIKVLIHELLHIPKRFTGGLRPHGKYVNSHQVTMLYKKYLLRKKSTVDKT